MRFLPNSDPVEKYFIAERVACWIGAGIGVAAIIAAVWFLWQVKRPFYTGMAYPLLVLGLFFLAICVGVALRSQSDIARVNAMLENDKSQIGLIEKPRMAAVMRNFRVIIIAEITMIVLSVAGLMFLSGPMWRGASAAVFIMAFLLLIFDWLAQARGKEYWNFLEGV